MIQLCLNTNRKEKLVPTFLRKSQFILSIPIRNTVRSANRKDGERSVTEFKRWHSVTQLDAMKGLQSGTAVNASGRNRA